ALDRERDLAALLLGVVDRARRFEFAALPGLCPADGTVLLDEGVALGRRRIEMAKDRHRDDLLPVAEHDASDAGGISPLKHPDVTHLEADGAATGTGEQPVVACRAGRHVDDAVALVELHGDLAVPPHLTEIGE